MTTNTESQECWESNLLGQKSYTAVGTREVLFLVSREIEGADIVPRKKGKLSEQDEERLSSEGIPPECWGDDVEIMKARCEKDKTKIVSTTAVDNPHMKKREALDQIRKNLNNTQQDGVIVHYIGPGKTHTGDWCFSDGFITFEDIAELYMQHFTGRTLTIEADCSYSGKWVEDCKAFLDRIGVQPCGHSARKKGIQLKVYCSCQLDQIGSTLLYSASGNRNDKNTGSGYVKIPLELSPDQKTYGIDFTKITCDTLPQEDCALTPNFTFQEKKNRSRIYVVRGKDRGRPAWHYVLLVDDPETIRIFKERTQGENRGTLPVDVTDYGTILKSGFGQDPPKEVQDWESRIVRGLEDIQYTSR